MVGLRDAGASSFISIAEDVDLDGGHVGRGSGHGGRG